MPIMASICTTPLAPIWRATLGYSGAFLYCGSAGVIWPPAVGFATEAEVSAGLVDAGLAGAAGAEAAPDMIEPKLPGAAAFARTSAGASAISAGAAGRSRCPRDSLSNCFTGVGLRTTACSSGGLGVESGDVASGLSAFGLLPGVFCLGPGCGPWVAGVEVARGEGRGSCTRSDSLVVLDWLASATSIWKLTSPESGGYTMLPVRTWLGSISMFS